MSAALRDALREQFDYARISTALAALVALNLLLDTPPAQLATMAATLSIGAVSEAVTDAYDLREDVRHLGFGVMSFVGAAALLVFADGSLVAPLVLAVIGGWVVLDSVQMLRHEGLREREETPDGREVYRNYVTRRVHETLQEQPRTRRELGDALEADEEDIDAAVERLRERGVVETRGSELRVPDEEESWPARAVEAARSAAARIARPITIEFSTSDQRDDSQHRTADVDTDATGGHRGAVDAKSGDRDESTPDRPSRNRNRGERELSRER